MNDDFKQDSHHKHADHPMSRAISSHALDQYWHNHFDNDEYHEHSIQTTDSSCHFVK